MAIIRFFSDLLLAFKTWRLRRIARAQLLKLSDHELADIGLHRGDIDSFA